MRLCAGDLSELIAYRLLGDADRMVIHRDQLKIVLAPGTFLLEGETGSERGLLNSIVCPGLRVLLVRFRRQPRAGSS